MDGKLTDADIESASIEPGKSSRALQDGRRLFLRITPDGEKQWRLKYQVAPGPAGERMKTLGEYPAVSIEAARQAADAVRASVKAPRVATPVPRLEAAAPPIPTAVRAAVNGTPADVPTFGTVGDHWVGFDKHITAAGLYRKRLFFEKLAELHALPITSVTVEQCIAAHDRIRAESGLHSAKRAGLYLSSIFKHAQRWRVIHNPAEDRRAWVGRSDNKALAERRQDAITDRDAFGLMMEQIDLWEGPQGPASSNFIKFIARVPVRASELAGAKWSEFRDLDDPAKALWIVPAERMKQRKEHHMPLSRQAVAVLMAQRAEIAERYPAGSDYVFPHRDTGKRHVDGDNQRRTLVGLGYGPTVKRPDGQVVTNSYAHSVHGFRHSFMTFAAEAGQSIEIADRVLAHEDRNRVRARYNLSAQLDQRRAMLQWWADQIEQMKNGYKVPA